MMNNNYSVYMTNNSMTNNDCDYNNTREEMFEKIKCLNFAIVELGLYLDTHPDDEKAGDLPSPGGAAGMKALLLWIIRFYQRNISPLRPPCCRFIPTCSAYALEAVEKYGAWKGGWLALRRILRCNPFHRQKSIQYDPVP